MNSWQKFRSHFWEVKLKEYDSALNGKLFVNLEHGKKVLHTKTANYSYQNLHKVLRFSIESIAHKLKPDPRILNLGLGGGSAMVILREELFVPGKVISIEHDEVIFQIAKEEFEMDRFADHDIIIEDALVYMQKVKSNTFDLIICDLFKDTEVPEKFKEESFFKLMIQGLCEGGHLIFNFVKMQNKDPFFIPFMDNLGDEYSYYVANPVKENHVLILHKT